MSDRDPSSNEQLQRELNQALCAEGQKDAWLEDLLQYLHYNPETKSHPDWVARAQTAEAELASLKSSRVETSCVGNWCETRNTQVRELQSLAAREGRWLP